MEFDYDKKVVTILNHTMSLEETNVVLVALHILQRVRIPHGMLPA
jgi:hypothetical protein